MNKDKALERMDMTHASILNDKLDYEVYGYTLVEDKEKQVRVIYNQVEDKWWLGKWNDYQDYWYFLSEISEGEALELIDIKTLQPIKTAKELFEDIHLHKLYEDEDCIQFSDKGFYCEFIEYRIWFFKKHHKYSISKHYTETNNTTYKDAMTWCLEIKKDTDIDITNTLHQAITQQLKELE